MTIDLKWGLPFVMPFVLYLWLRALWWFAGAEWDADFAAFFCTLLGAIVGVAIVGILTLDDKKWLVRIGGKE